MMKMVLAYDVARYSNGCIECACGSRLQAREHCFQCLLVGPDKRARLRCRGEHVEKSRCAAHSGRYIANVRVGVTCKRLHRSNSVVRWRFVSSRLLNARDM